jgi:flap endonuclease-1
MGTKLGDIVDATPVTLTDLSGRKIAVDAFNTIYAFLSIIRQMGLRYRTGRGE